MTPPDEASGAEPPANKDKAAKNKTDSPKTSDASNKSEAGAASKQSRAKKAAAKKSDDKLAGEKSKAAGSVGDAGSKAEASDKPAATKTGEIPPSSPPLLSPPAAKSGVPGGAIGTAVLLLVAGALGGLVATFMGGSSPTDEELAAADPIVAARVTELQAKIDNLEAQASGASDQVTALENTLGELRSGDIAETARLVDELDDRLAGLEQSVSNIVSVPIEDGTPIGAAVISELSSGLSDVRQTVSELEGQLAGRVGALEATAPPANLDQILRGLASRDDLSTLGARVGSLEEDRTGSDAKRAALALALANLSRAAETGAPFDAELEAVAILAPNQKSIGMLRTRAGEGLPTQPELLAQFETVIDGVLEVERIAQADGWFAQLWAWLSSFVSVRQTGDIEGTGTEAILARAEFNLDDGNLKAAAEELAQLDGPSADAVADWKRGLDAHIALDELVGTLTTQVLTSLGQ